MQLAACGIKFLQIHRNSLHFIKSHALINQASHLRKRSWQKFVGVLHCQVLFVVFFIDIHALKDLFL